MTKIKPVSPSHHGYIEGYYGRLLSWQDRHRLIDHLAHLEMTAYFYAPKEDPYHRFQWRQAYGDDWRQSFRAFTAYAKDKGIRVIAGIAPGLDFDFSSLSNHLNDGGGGDGDDYTLLLNKAQQLLADGADEIGLLMDDIDPGFPGHAGEFHHDGEAHTALANALGRDLDAPLSLTPRVYADNIEDDGLYLPHLAQHLDQAIKVFTCGHHIVAADTALLDTNIVKAGISEDRLIIWDNLYAHDYCPRRLFLGPYRGRHDGQAIMLNPTGLLETDMMLLSLTQGGGDKNQWRRVLSDEGVPDAFFDVAPAFWGPPFPEDKTAPWPSPLPTDQGEALLKALDALLWRWKSPLQREWYPFLMGMRQDILLSLHRMTRRRIAKTAPPLLAPHLKHLASPKG